MLLSLCVPHPPLQWFSHTLRDQLEQELSLDSAISAAEPGTFSVFLLLLPYHLNANYGQLPWCALHNSWDKRKKALFFSICIYWQCAGLLVLLIRRLLGCHARETRRLESCSLQLQLSVAKRKNAVTFKIKAMQANAIQNEWICLFPFMIIDQSIDWDVNYLHNYTNFLLFLFQLDSTSAT